jgi:hypothetical protein
MRGTALARRVWTWGRIHEGALWWLHSAWALAWGVVFMWLGTRQFAWLRVAFVYIGFIWLTSLLLPVLAGWGRMTPRRGRWLRLAINYVNKNFYQQLLFFVLPIYAASVTWGSPNTLFLVLVAASAALSTFDVVYDRHLSASRALTAVFFAFNMFVCVNAALPVLWSISTHQAMRISGALAILGFVTLRFQPRRLVERGVQISLAASMMLLVFFIEWGRPFVPPAPLRMLSGSFGRGIDRTALTVTQPLTALPSDYSGRLYGISAIYAPLGLQDRVRHRWVSGGRELHRSPYYALTGGRRAGFRLWTSARVSADATRGPIDLWVETEAGQIVGWARLPLARASP